MGNPEDGAVSPAVSPAAVPSSVSANADNSAVTRNALTGYVAWALNLGIGLVVTPILLRGLGAESFGAWTLAVTVASYVGMVELGLGTATVRHLASSLALGDTARASRVAASARATYLAMALAGAFVLAGLVLLPSLLAPTTGIASGRVRLTVLVLGLGYLLSLPVSVYPAIAVGAGRTDLGTIIGMAVRMATAAAQVVAVLTLGSLAALALVTASGVVIGTLAVRAVTPRRFREVDVRLKTASRDTVHLLLSSGWRNAVIGIAAAVAIQSDVLVVGAVIGATAVAAYGIAVRASTMVQALATRATDVLVPTFAHTTALEDTRRTVTAFRESVFLSRAILVPALVALAAFGEPLLKLWLRNVPTGAHSVLVLLVAGAIIAAPGYSSFVLLTGMNRLNYLLVGASITAVANLALSVLLTWQFGIVGPVLASIAGFLVWDMIILPRHVGSMLRIPWLPLSAAGLGSLALPTLAASGAAWATIEGLGWRTPRQGLAGATVVGVVYFAVLWTTIEPVRRERYARLIGGTTKRRPGAS